MKWRRVAVLNCRGLQCSKKKKKKKKKKKRTS